MKTLRFNCSNVHRPNRELCVVSVHISMEDAMRTAALQMMYYMQEWVAKLSAANLEEAERNG